MVGKLYKAGDSRTDTGFSLFYAGINLGALLGGYFCIAIGKGEMFSSFIPEDKRWNVAFSLAAIVMVVSLVIYLYSKKIRPIGLQPQTLNSRWNFFTYGKMERIWSLCPFFGFCTNNYDDGFYNRIHRFIYVYCRSIDAHLSIL